MFSKKGKKEKPENDNPTPGSDAKTTTSEKTERKDKGKSKRPAENRENAITQNPKSPGETGKPKKKTGKSATEKETWGEISGAPLNAKEAGGKTLTDKAFVTIRDTIDCGKITENPEIINAFIRTVFAKKKFYDVATLGRFVNTYGIDKCINTLKECLSASFRRNKSPYAYLDLIDGLNSVNEKTIIFDAFTTDINENCDKDYVNEVTKVSKERILKFFEQKNWKPEDVFREWRLKLAANVELKKANELPRNPDDAVGKLKNYNAIIKPDLEKWGNVEEINKTEGYSTILSEYIETLGEAVKEIHEKYDYDKFLDCCGELNPYKTHAPEYKGVIHKAAGEVLFRKLKDCESPGKFNEDFEKSTNDAVFKEYITEDVADRVKKDASCCIVKNLTQPEKMLEWINGLDDGPVNNDKFEEIFTSVFSENSKDFAALKKNLEAVKNRSWPLYCRVAVKCSDGTGTTDRGNLEYLYGILEDVRDGNGVPEYERVFSDISGKLAALLESNFREDGTVDAPEDIVAYAKYCGTHKDHDREKTRLAIGVGYILNENPQDNPAYVEYIKGKYAAGHDPEDPDSIASDFYKSYGMTDKFGNYGSMANGVLAEDVGVFIRSLAAFAPSDPVGKCYFSAVVAKLNEAMVPNMLHLDPETAYRLCAATETYGKNVDCSNILLGYAAISALTKTPMKTDCPSELARYLKNYAEWRIDQSLHLGHVTEKLFAESEKADGFISCLLKLADSELYAFEGKVGFSLDCLSDGLAAVYKQMDGGNPPAYWKSLFPQFLVAKYDMHTIAGNYSQADEVGTEMEKADRRIATIMRAYASYKQNIGNRPELTRSVRHMNKFVDNVGKESPDGAEGSDAVLLAAAYYVLAAIEYETHDWKNMEKHVLAAESFVSDRTQRETLLRTDIIALKGNLAKAQNNTVEAESLINEASGLLEDLPQSYIVKNNLRRCNEILDCLADDSAPHVRETHVSATETVFFPSSNRYAVANRPIGTGGGHNVFQAVDTVTNSTVALRTPNFIGKITTESPTVDRKLAVYFDLEMEIWETVSQEAPEHVVVLLEHSLKPFPWCVCEYADATMDRKLNSMNKKQKIQAIRSVLSALDVIHSENYVHNDVKPNNIFRVGEKWKLGDFDSAFEEGYPKNISVTHMYASPELLECYKNVESGGENITVKSDIWSVGVLMYYMLNNMSDPFGNPDDENYSERQRSGEFIPGQLNREFDRIYERIFRVDPAERPSASELIEMIDGIEN